MNKFPICVVIYLTDYCTLKCKHCFLTQNNSLNKNMIEYSILKKVLDDLKENNVYMIAYTGGDPMVHPDIFEILNYTSKLDMLPLLGISGIGITNEKAEMIYNSGVRCVQIGLNGSRRSLNDKYRGYGVFDKIKKSISVLQKNGLNVNLSYCLNKSNYNDLSNMLYFSDLINAYKVKIEFWKSMDNIKENELNEKEMLSAYNICADYMNRNNKSDWIQCPKSQSNLSKIHKSAIVIMPNGDVKRNELSETLGNIYINNIIDIIQGDVIKNER